MVYKVTAPYAPANDHGFLWSDPDLAIDWGFDPAALVLSDKDRVLPRLAEIDEPLRLGGRGVRLLVLGAAGQLGGDVMAAAAAAGIEARGATRADVDVGDLGALRTFLETERFDALVNCVALLNTEAIEGDPAPAVTVNGHAPAVMAEVAAAKGARMIQISTDYVFGGDAGRTTPLVEDDPVAPVNVYGLTKAFGETLARLDGADVAVFRVASTFGVRGAAGKGGNFVETMIRMGREKGALKVVADQVMSPTSTAWAAAGDPRLPGEGRPGRRLPRGQHRRGLLVRVREGDRREGRGRGGGQPGPRRGLALEGAPPRLERPRQRQARRRDRSDPGLGGGARRLSGRQGASERARRDLDGAPATEAPQGTRARATNLLKTMGNPDPLNRTFTFMNASGLDRRAVSGALPAGHVPGAAVQRRPRRRATTPPPLLGNAPRADFGSAPGWCMGPVRGDL